MHILANDEDPRGCVDCAARGRVRWVRRLYGANNEPLCLWCHAERHDAWARAARASRHEPDAVLDQWEPT